MIRNSSDLWWFDSGTMSVVLGKELGGISQCSGCRHCLCDGCKKKKMLNAIFPLHFFFFFVKAKILFGFLSVSKRYRGWAFEKSEMVLGNLLKMGEYFNFI